MSDFRPLTLFMIWVLVTFSLFLSLGVLCAPSHRKLSRDVGEGEDGGGQKGKLSSDFCVKYGNVSHRLENTRASQRRGIRRGKELKAMWAESPGAPPRRPRLRGGPGSYMQLHVFQWLRWPLV